MYEITKNAIVNAFKKLAAKKDISEITVVEITNECGLKRQTFYNHFKDKYDLIKWIYTNEVIIKIDNSNKNWKEKFKDMFYYFVNNKNMVLNIYNSENQHYILHFIFKQSKPFIKNFVEEKIKNVSISNFDIDFLTLFYTGSLGAILINWIELGMPDIFDDIVEKTGKVLSGNIKNYINNE